MKHETTQRLLDLIERVAKIERELNDMDRFDDSNYGGNDSEYQDSNWVDSFVEQDDLSFGSEVEDTCRIIDIKEWK